MFPGQYVYKRIAISDMPSTPIVEHFADAFQFIDEGRATPGGVVLVHCYYGNSRSATIIIGYHVQHVPKLYKPLIIYTVRQKVSP